MSVDSELNYRLFIHRETDFERTTYQEEISNYKAVQSGDTETVLEEFREERKSFMDGKGLLSNDPVRNVIYHFVVSVSIISRLCIEGGLNIDTSYTMADIYIRKADSCTEVEPVLDLFEEMLVDYSKRMKQIKKSKVVSIHIRRCVDYIYDHLHEKLTVKELAGHLNLNPSYLSKLFVKETGENIGDFILSAKVKTAENMLRFSDFSYLEIASALGFASQSHFINVFKKHTGITPRAYKKLYYNKSDIDLKN